MHAGMASVGKGGAVFRLVAHICAQNTMRKDRFPRHSNLAGGGWEGSSAQEPGCYFTLWHQASVGSRRKTFFFEKRSKKILLFGVRR
jgi:hypothetical protein